MTELGMGLAAHQARLCNLEFREASTWAQQAKINQHYSLVEDMNYHCPQLMSEWLFQPPVWLGGKLTEWRTL
jgi:hypothetical protein